MSIRTRLATLGVTTAVVGGVLAAAPAPAHAATVGSTVDYSCTQYGVLGLPTGVTGPVALDLAILENLTVPVGGTLQKVTGTLEVDGLVALLGTTAADLLGSVEGLAFRLGETVTEAERTGTTIGIPSLPVPTQAGSYPITAPDQFVVRTLGGLLGSLVCAVDPLDKVVSTLLVQRPQADPGAGGPVVGEGGTAAVAVDPTAPNPCQTLPGAAAGARRTTIAAASARKTVPWTKRPGVEVEVNTRKRAARGTVVACYGWMKVGEAQLKKGRALVKTVRFYPGKYRLRVVYLGSAKAQPRAKAVVVRVKR